MPPIWASERAILGLAEGRITQHRTIRHRYLAIPGRLVTHARRRRLRLPADGPWRARFLAAVERLRPPYRRSGSAGFRLDIATGGDQGAMLQPEAANLEHTRGWRWGAP